MLSTSLNFQNEIATQTKAREVYGKIEFRQFDPLARASCTPTASSTDPVSNINYIIDEVEGTLINYATWEPDRFLLDGSFKLMPTSAYLNMGWWSQSQSDSITKQFSGGVLVTCQFSGLFSSIGLTIMWDRTNGEYAEDFTIQWRNIVGYVIATADIVANTESLFVMNAPISDYYSIDITIHKWSKGGRRARMEEIQFGIVNTYSKELDNLISFKVQEEIDIISSKDVPNKLDFSIDNSDGLYDILNPSGFYAYTQTNQEVNAWLGILNGDYVEYVSVGKYYLSNWETNQNSLEAKFTAMDILNLLHQKTYYKGIIGTSNLYDLAVAVFTDYGLPANKYYIDPILSSIAVYNPLKICTYKEAIQQIAIAGQCVYYVDRSGIINIKRVGTDNIGYTIEKDNMREPTPKITLDPIIKSVDVKVNTLTVAGSTSTLAKVDTYINGVQDIWIIYDNMGSNWSSSISSGVINTATYYTNACLLNVTATGNTTITITGKEITVSSHINSTPGSTEGTVLNVDNILISTTTVASDVGSWILGEMDKRNVFNVQYRMNPSFEICDLVNMETQFNDAIDTRIIKQTLEWDGGLRGTITTKGNMIPN